MLSIKYLFNNAFSACALIVIGLLSLLFYGISNASFLTGETAQAFFLLPLFALYFVFTGFSFLFLTRNKKYVFFSSGAFYAFALSLFSGADGFPFDVFNVIFLSLFITIHLGILFLILKPGETLALWFVAAISILSGLYASAGLIVYLFVYVLKFNPNVLIFNKLNFCGLVGLLLASQCLMSNVMSQVKSLKRKGLFLFLAVFYLVFSITSSLSLLQKVQEEKESKAKIGQVLTTVSRDIKAYLQESLPAIERFFKRLPTSSMEEIELDANAYLNDMPALTLAYIAQKKRLIDRPSMSSNISQKILAQCQLSDELISLANGDKWNDAANMWMCIKNKDKTAMFALSLFGLLKKHTLHQLYENMDFSLLPASLYHQQLFQSEHLLSKDMLIELDGLSLTLRLSWLPGSVAQFSNSWLPLIAFFCGLLFSIAIASVIFLIYSLRMSVLVNKKKIVEQKILKDNVLLILNKSPLAIFVINKQGKISYFNDKAKELSGYSSTELAGMLVDKFLPKNKMSRHKEKREEYFYKRISRQMNSDGDLCLITKQGLKVPVGIDLLAIDFNGKPHVMCRVRDVSKQKAFERKLDEQYDHTQLILDITNMSNELTHFDDFMKVALDKTCRTLNWDIGHIYIFKDTENQCLSSSDIWYLSDPERSMSFMELSKTLSFKLGQGVLGKVWQDKKFVSFKNIADEKNFLRVKVGKHGRVASALFIPIIFESNVVSIIEIFSFDEKSVSDNLKMTMELLGQQISRAFERKDASMKLEKLAHYDEITGLPNRSYFLDIFERSIKKSKRDNANFALLYLDLDDFKKVNDALGHLIGDKLLKIISDHIKQSAQGVDFIARIGGDEFILLTEEIINPDETGHIAQRVLSLFKTPFKIDNYKIEVSMSIGIAVYPFAGKDKNSLLRNADIAMYRSKELGKNQYQFYTNKLNIKHARALAIENGLKKALIKQEFFLVYQSQIDITKNAISGFEVLLRWNSSDLGMVPPFEFISKAEDMGLIHEIGYWVLKNACLQFNEWKEIFEEQGITPKLSVNLSVVQLSNKDIISHIKESLSVFNFPPSKLVLELTESSFMNNINKSKAMLEKINSLGVGIAIDDFGTGYSSFNYLKKLPYTELKIDKSFIDEIENDQEGRSIIKAIIHLAEVMNLDIVAEGVEEKEQLQYLIKYNEALCSRPILVQGYYFSKPLMAQEIVAYIKGLNKK